MHIKDHLLCALLLIAATFLVYYDSFNNSFVHDDNGFIVENTSIRNLNIKSLVSYFTDKGTTASRQGLAGDVWRPLVTTSFAIDYRLWGLKPKLYHVENTALHSVNAILVYITVFLISGDIVTAFIGSCIFSLHPVQAEAVTWISGRSNVLFLLFFLSSFIFHIRRRKYEAVFFYAVSLLSKEMAITLPLVCILYDIHFAPRNGIRDYIKYYSLFFLVALMYLAARFSVLEALAQSEAWWGGNFFYSALAALKAVGSYMRLLLLPFDLRVSYLVDIPKSILDIRTLMSVSAISIITVAWIIFRKQKAVSFWLGWFFVSLIPVYNIVPFKAVMSERFLYLPMIAFAALIGMVLSNLRRFLIERVAIRYLWIFMVMAVFISYAALTISRNIEWRDELTFYTHEATRSPIDPRCRYNLGYAYANEARSDKNRMEMRRLYYSAAIKEYNASLSVNPRFEPAYAGLGNVYNELGLYDLAVENFKKALVIKEDPDIYNNIGVAYYHKKAYDKTIVSCKRALSLHPAHSNAYINLGNAYFMKHEYHKAKLAWLGAVRLGTGAEELERKVKTLEGLGY